MSKVRWCVTEEDEQDDHGYWYRKPGTPTVRGPGRWDPSLNMTTVGWKREPRGNGYRETIRLPEGRFWHSGKRPWNPKTGLGVHPDDPRCLSRQVRDPLCIDGNTIFDSNGYMYKYFDEWLPG